MDLVVSLVTEDVSGADGIKEIECGGPTSLFEQ
jgi:hypothetical protein